jgi:plasmid stabilization system protein ParE
VRIIWTPQALQDRTDVSSRIETENPQAASRTDELFSQAAFRLSDHPKLGKTGKSMKPKSPLAAFSNLTFDLSARASRQFGDAE